MGQGHPLQDDANHGRGAHSVHMRWIRSRQMTASHLRPTDHVVAGRLAVAALEDPRAAGRENARLGDSSKLGTSPEIIGSSR